MAVFRVERTTGYTVMSNHHLRNKELIGAYYISFEYSNGFLLALVFGKSHVRICYAISIFFIYWHNRMFNKHIFPQL